MIAAMLEQNQVCVAEHVVTTTRCNTLDILQRLCVLQPSSIRWHNAPPVLGETSTQQICCSHERGLAGVMQTRLTAREQRVASREQTIHHVDAESASQVAEAQAAAAASYSHARRDLQQEFTAQKEALLRERQVLEADRYLPYICLCHRLSPARRK